MENKLVTTLTTYIDKSEKEIENIISTMNYKDVVNLQNALDNNNKEIVLDILHGYGI